MAAVPQHYEVTEHIVALVPEWQRDDLAGIRFLEGGYGNHNYYFRHRGEAFAIRIPFARQPYVDHEREQTLYAGLPEELAPTLVALDPQRGTLITRWIDGSLLVDRRQTTTDELAAFVMRLHTHMPDEDRDYDPYGLARRYLAAGSAPPEILDIAGKAWQPERSSSCHNDLNPWNVIVRKDGWIALDWEFAGRNDPLFDVVNLVEGLELNDDALLEVARKVAGDDLDLERLAACYEAFWLREYAWAHHQIDTGNDRAEIRDQVTIAYDKLRQRSISA